MTEKIMREAITTESELVSKLQALTELEIFDFMKNLRGGTFFNMGMYSFIKVSRAYKKTIRIYKVTNQTSIVSGVSYENISTTKDFRNQTGKEPGGSWYSHMDGYENKVGLKKSDPSCKYVLWNIKAGSDCWVRYYAVDIDSGMVKPISLHEILTSDYLTPSEKKDLEAHPSTGYNLDTGEIVENQTKWRTAAFEHIFWLSQAGKSTKEYGTRFTEDKESMSKKDTLKEENGTELFRDAHANVTTDLDAILSGSMDEDYQRSLSEHHHPELEDWFCDECGEKMNYDLMFPHQNEDGDEELICDKCHDKLTSTELPESKISGLKESYRRIISRGKLLTDNELFVDFD